MAVFVAGTSTLSPGTAYLFLLKISWQYKCHTEKSVPELVSAIIVGFSVSWKFARPYPIGIYSAISKDRRRFFPSPIIWRFLIWIPRYLQLTQYFMTTNQFWTPAVQFIQVNNYKMVHIEHSCASVEMDPNIYEIWLKWKMSQKQYWGRGSDIA